MPSNVLIQPRSPKINSDSNNYLPLPLPLRLLRPNPNPPLDRVDSSILGIPTRHPDHPIRFRSNNSRFRFFRFFRFRKFRPRRRERSHRNRLKVGSVVVSLKFDLNRIYWLVKGTVKDLIACNYQWRIVKEVPYFKTYFNILIYFEWN